MKTLFRSNLMALVIIPLAVLVSCSPDALGQNCVQATSDMISWWTGDSDALDIRSRSNGTMLGDTWFVPGYKGKAIQFDGAGDAIRLGAAPSLLSNSMTIETWINKTGVPQNSIEDILAKWYFDASGDSYLFGVVKDGGQVRAFSAIGDGATGDGGMMGGTIVPGEWTHVAMTYDSGLGLHKLFVNGVEVASRTRPNGVFSSGTDVYLGREFAPDAGRDFNGLIDELAVYSRALPPADIQAIYNARQAGKCRPPAVFSQTQTVFHSGLALQPQFGTSVAASGDRVVVGSVRDVLGSGEISGTASVYKKTTGGWLGDGLLTPLASGSNDGDEFGASVAISGDTVVVGAPFSRFDGTRVGTATIFERDTSGIWVRKQRLAASDRAENDEFGNSVAVDGDTIVIGAPGVDQSGQPDSGAVYVFKRTGATWSQTQKLINTGTNPGGDGLGEAVAIHGETLVAGAPIADNPWGHGGTVYVFGLTGGSWAEKQKLLPLGSYDDARFGRSLAVEGGTLVAGHPGGTSGMTGYAIVFQNVSGTWTQARNLFGGIGASGGMRVGSSVAIGKATIAVGSLAADTTGGTDAGAVYIFPRHVIGGYDYERQKVESSTAAAASNFGAGVAISGNNTLFVGSPHERGDAGDLHIFNTTDNIPFDYDADGKADMSVYRPASGLWFLRRSTAGAFGMQFGNSTDIIAPADYDGDGKTDLAAYRPSTGFWYIWRSPLGPVDYHLFGLAEDIPVPADYDGDGQADICVFRPSTGTWYRRNSFDGSFYGIQFGLSGDRPTVGDFDGDGKADIGIWRPSTGDWYHIRSSNGSLFGERFGISTDKMVPADYDGDGQTDIAIWRPSNGIWYIKNSSTSTYTSYAFGLATDIPAPADYDGDGKADRSIFRPSDGNWYITNSFNGTFTIFPWGQNGDRPTPSAFLN